MGDEAAAAAASVGGVDAVTCRKERKADRHADRIAALLAISKRANALHVYYCPRHGCWHTGKGKEWRHGNGKNQKRA